MKHRNGISKDVWSHMPHGIKVSTEVYFCELRVNFSDKELVGTVLSRPIIDEAIHNGPITTSLLLSALALLPAAAAASSRSALLQVLEKVLHLPRG